MRKIFVVSLAIVFCIFLSDNVQASSLVVKTTSQNLTLKKEIKHKTSTKEEKQVGKKQMPQIEALRYNFYTNCSGISVNCGYVYIYYNPADMTIWRVDSFSACDDPNVCAGIYGQI